jgi:hypothetical protein
MGLVLRWLGAGAGRVIDVMGWGMAVLMAVGVLLLVLMLPGWLLIVAGLLLVWVGR